MSDTLLFVVLPYAATLFAIAATIVRFNRLREAVTARSTHVFNSRVEAGGLLAWRWSMILILLAHLLATIVPGLWGLLLANSSRVYAVETSGVALSILALIGIATLIVRRFKATPAVADWLVLVSAALQILTGVFIAVALRWGARWYLHTAGPWLRSLLLLDPKVMLVAILPWPVKLHIVNAFVLLAILPLSRAAHVVTVPFAYLSRLPVATGWRTQHAHARR